MKVKHLFYLCIGISIMLALGLLYLPASAYTSYSPYHPLVSDDFDSPILSDHWQWVREDPAYWSLTERPGYLRIIAQNGDLYGPGGDQENILLTEAPAGDYRLITKVDFAPTQNYEEAGLLIYQDVDNYIYLGRDYANGQKIRFRNEIAGSPDTFTVDETATTVYLRIYFESGVYKGFYSLNGVNWESVGVFTNHLTNPRVGISATYGLDGDELAADFDMVELVSIPYNQTWSEDFNATTVDEPWYWVRENPANWSLTAVLGSMQLTSEGGIHQDSNNASNILLMQPPQENFRITTQLTVSPTLNFQYASLLVYQDDDNFLRVSRDYSNGGKVRFRMEENGVASTASYVDETATTLYLRIVKRGDNYTAYYSLDEIDWIPVGYYYFPLTAPKVGILSQDGGAEIPLVATYHSFTIDYYENLVYLPLSIKGQ